MLKNGGGQVGGDGILLGIEEYGSRWWQRSSMEDIRARVGDAGADAGAGH